VAFRSFDSSTLGRAAGLVPGRINGRTGKFA
jgi:hypothetical protein